MQNSLSSLLLFTTLWTPYVCRAGTKVTVGHKLPAGRLVSIDYIDHEQWNSLLKRFVDREGRVAYAQWKTSREASRRLAEYLATLSTANPHLRASKSARLAFWINAYNALTIEGILREYPTSSIRKHTARLFGYNIWHDLLLLVGGQPYSLHQMEHEVLRKMNDPRIHFGVVCASVSCPRLLNEAYQPQGVEAQLEANAKHFFSKTSNFRYDAARRQFYLTRILKWYGQDFGTNQAEQLDVIAKYLPDRPSMRAASSNTGSVSFLPYNWQLNDQARSARH